MMPNHGPILYHLLCTPIAFFSIFFAHYLSKRYRHSFLLPYFYYVVLDSLTTMSDVFFRILPVQLRWSGLIPQGSPLTGLFLSLFTLPFQMLMLYFFILAGTKLFGLTLRRWFPIVYWSVQALIFILSIVGITLAINQQSGGLMQGLGQVNGILSVVCLFGTLALGIRPIIKEKVSENRSFQIVFCLNYFLFFAFQILLGYLPLYGVWVTVLVFGIHLPVLAFLPRFLARTAQTVPRTAQLSLDVGKLYDEQGVSKREQEIIALVIQGCSNREIEDRLFISRRTVENHIYKIYRKLGVKNRVQLMGLVEGTAIHRV